MHATEIDFGKCAIASSVGSSIRGFFSMRTFQEFVIDT